MEGLLDKKGLRWFIAISALFLGVVGAAIYLERFEILFLPIILAVIYAAFFHLDKLLLFVVFTTPFSLNIEELGVEGIGLYLPTEPILFGIMLIFLMRQFHKSEMDAKFLRHPITIAIALNLLWMFMTCISSENPVVSWKYFIARLWFVVPIFFLGVMIFRKDKNIITWLWAFIIPLTGIIIYTLVRHAIHSFGEEEGHWVMTPFFRDHTSYGAIVAMFYPVVIGFLLDKKQQVPVRLILLTIFIIFTLGLIFSYTRAAWLSLVGVLLVYIAMRIKIKFSLIAGVIVIGSTLLIANWDQIQQNLERNKSEHATEDFAERIESMSNITTDASNLERLNLWNASILMFQERPMLGWGPGTFQFNYGKFQHYDDFTIISEKSGRDVNAHSEYLNPLAESGLFGMLSIIAIVLAIVVTGVRLWYRMEDPKLKMVLLTVLLGAITYWSHGILNNYMDVDKASVAVWGFAAIILAMDIYHRKTKSIDSEA